MKAMDAANELKKIVAALEAIPDTHVGRLHLFFTRTGKEEFKALARVLPRPLKKSIKDEGKSYAELVLEYESDSLWVRTSTSQSSTCRLISPAIPAKYECEPILSPEEDAEFGGAR